MGFPNRQRRQKQLVIRFLQFAADYSIKLFRTFDGPISKCVCPAAASSAPRTQAFECADWPNDITGYFERVLHASEPALLLWPRRDNLRYGLPEPVTSTGAPVRRTSSSTARHVALNFEMAISFTSDLYQSQRPWSNSPKAQNPSIIQTLALGISAQIAR